VIDVGINRIADGRLIMTSTDGGVAERARGITPVLAGGPMTAVTLMQHGQAAEQG
jgi:5,10-methylene-tetrahydrofolate dehydrogenase/methenyl tetrahydrofolate cyclohydrolase